MQEKINLINDLGFSQIALGFWRLNDWNMNPLQIRQLIEESLGLGINTFDHADIYGRYICEEMFGQILAEISGKRDQMKIVTKCGIRLVSVNRPQHTFHGYDTSMEHILASVDTSLKNLRCDYIDLLLIHRPDPLMDAVEVAEAFSLLKSSGKVLYFGISNFTPFQFDLLQSKLRFPLVTNQVEVSVLHMAALHDGTLDQCQQLGITPMVWSPMAGGRLMNDHTERTIRVRNELHKTGEELGGYSVEQVALAWLLMHPSKMMPILGTGKTKRIQDAVAASGLKLSRDQWFRIWTASAGHEVP